MDTNVLLLAVIVTTANSQDHPGGKRLLRLLAQRYPSVALVWAAAGYANEKESSLVGWARAVVGVVLSVVHRPAGVMGFQRLPRWWVMERTFAWMSRRRRVARDGECEPEHAEAMFKVAMVRILAARSAGEADTPWGPVEEEAARGVDERVP